MRTFVEALWVRPCRQCGADTVYPGVDVDGGVVRLEPAPVLGVDAMQYVGPHRVAWGWSYTGRYWRVHRFADDPLAYAFLEHSCSGDSLTKGDTMTADPFGSAAPPGATGPAMKDLHGKLLLVTVHAIERGIVINGQKDPADAAKCDIVDLTSGEVHTGAALWGKVIVNQLAPGTKYVGRVMQGQATGSNNPPWTWQDGDDNDKAVGVRYLTYAASQSVATAPAAPAAPAPVAPVATPVAPVAPAAPVAAAPAAPAASAPVAPPWAQ